MVDAPTIDAEDELLTTVETAELLGVSRPTIQAWAWRGRIPARETPLGLLFRRQDVERFKAARGAA